MGKLTQKTIDLIKRFEGLRLTAYLDSADVPTIGWGHTKGVHLGMKITESGARQLLIEDLAVAVAGVNRTIKRPMNNNEFGAFVSLTHNIGVGGFATSTVARMFNKGDKRKAGQAFLMWDKITINKKKVVSNGLVNRRIFERDYFFKVVDASVALPSTDYETAAGQGGEHAATVPPAWGMLGVIAATIAMFWNEVEAFFANLF